ncbi:acyl carrier protein [Vibrio sp. VPAP30]|uniref:acyl carrier protein n=1 Tax=Vibrio sp. VPAP30 TaxID=1647102 RepID=UPI00065A0AE1|nr:acyl carrier protein [Vibrio sp. VPAP30]KLN66037.1 hypothetical protein ZX61_06545 [Vibrio sp. VPAP30]
MNKSDIVQNVINVIIYDNLELGELGVERSEIQEHTLLRDASGLGLDSIDTLDVLVGVQETYHIQIDEISKSLMNEICQTPSTIADFVLQHNNNSASNNLS